MSSSTGFMAACHRRYLRTPGLAPERELDLVRRWQEQGDEEARRILIESNMRHVVTIATRFRRYPIAYVDLISEGSLGLVIAIDRFDPGKGVRLVTYASYWIRACVFQAVIKEWKGGKTGLGMTRSKIFFKIRRLLSSQMALHGADGPRLEEMAAELDVSVESLREMLACLDRHDMSLDADPDGGRLHSMHDRLSDGRPGPEAVASSLEGRDRARDMIERALGCLDERERIVVSERLMQEEPRTLAELGEHMGVSRERARQIEVRTKQKLGRALMRQGLTRAGVSAFFA